MKECHSQCCTYHHMATGLGLIQNGDNYSSLNETHPAGPLQQYPTFCCLHETYLTGKQRNRLKVKGQKMIFHENKTGMQKVAILISGKTDIKSKLKGTKSHYVLRKVLVHQEVITNMY